jgi:RimJ/RimL family protein N-acetyltransferase
MEKAGLRREGFFRENILKSGKYEDVVFYGLLRNDYKNTKV